MANLLSEIEKAIDNFDFEFARNKLREELRERPSADAYYLASVIAEGDTQRKFFLEKALSIDPFHPKVLTALGKSKPESTAKATFSSPTTPKPFEAVQQTHVSKNKTSGWRRINTLVLLLIFFAPWIRSCDGELNGYQYTYNLGTGLLSIGSAENDTPVVIVVLYFLVLVGLLSILVFCILNFYTTFNKDEFDGKSFLNKLMLFLLATGVVSLSIILITNLRSLKDLLWGFWATWLGMLSSIWLELRVYFMRKS